MADSASESDTDGAGGSGGAPGALAGGGGGGSSAAGPGVGGGGKAGGIVISPFRLEELTNRLASLQQENKVLKIELETYKLKCKALQEENRDLRKASVTIQARAEQEEEFISNTLFKKIQALQKEKETLAVNYEKEEEFLTNELSRKLMQLQHEKAELEQHLEQEQEFQVNKLMKKIKKLENDTISKQLTLEQLRREKIDLENTLEQEQEALVNRLWKRMDKLEAEKRILQEKLDQPVSAPPSPRDISMEIDSPENMMRHIRFLKNEVERLKKQLRAAQLQHSEKMAQYLEEERHMREENLRLQRKLQREMERREALCRQLSESESSLEMDDERYFNEMSAQGLRPRTVSSPIPYTPSPSSSRPISPGLSYASHTVGFTPPTSLTRAGMSYYNSPGLHVQHMGPSHGITKLIDSHRRTFFLEEKRIHCCLKGSNGYCPMDQLAVGLHHEEVTALTNLSVPLHLLLQTRRPQCSHLLLHHHHHHLCSLWPSQRHHSHPLFSIQCIPPLSLSACAQQSVFKFGLITQSSLLKAKGLLTWHIWI
ncbi:coiled-coil domain-containing protein 6 isoform X1 [Alligator mississippiensis]|uniref:coiled-coil domain-containing protein 6 isoform X1 n=1 Tax=Alligator mississippiensis TaxID=8496 RepID=UPI0028778058|nr:coiled-coil domain-containing protein 6 isoform X1 [Alligator mississippiensis]